METKYWHNPDNGAIGESVGLNERPTPWVLVTQKQRDEILAAQDKETLKLIQVSDEKYQASIT